MKKKKAVSFSLPPNSSASSSSSRFGYASIGSQRQRLIFKLWEYIHLMENSKDALEYSGLLILFF